MPSDKKLNLYPIKSNQHHGEGGGQQCNEKCNQDGHEQAQFVFDVELELDFLLFAHNATVS